MGPLFATADEINFQSKFVQLAATEWNEKKEEKKDHALNMKRNKT